MPQYTIFGEVEQDTMPQPEAIEELPEAPVPHTKNKFHYIVRDAIKEP